jgi:hypothetical protein
MHVIGRAVLAGRRLGARGSSGRGDRGSGRGRLSLRFKIGRAEFGASSLGASRARPVWLLWRLHGSTARWHVGQRETEQKASQPGTHLLKIRHGGAHGLEGVRQLLWIDPAGGGDVWDASAVRVEMAGLALVALVTQTPDAVEKKHERTQSEGRGRGRAFRNGSRRG